MNETFVLHLLWFEKSVQAFRQEHNHSQIWNGCLTLCTALMMTVSCNSFSMSSAREHDVFLRLKAKSVNVKTMFPGKASNLYACNNAPDRV
jgi:hypothetical protein